MDHKEYLEYLKTFDKADEDWLRINIDITERIKYLIDTKYEGKHKRLADKLGVSEANVSRMLSGVQNFTLRTIMKLQHAFGEKIIEVVGDPNDELVDLQYVKRDDPVETVTVGPDGINENILENTITLPE